MYTTSENIYRKILECLENKTPAILATVIKTAGSCPAPTGAKAIISKDGLLAGTVGGGSLEKQIIQEGVNLLKNNLDSKLCEFKLNVDLGMVCGGAASVFLEKIKITEAKVVVFGAGHVAQALIDVLLYLKFTVTCVDHRTEWLDKLPNIDKLQKVLVNTYSEYVKQVKENDFIVIMTPGHKYDFSVLEKLIEQGDKYPYIAVIGSKNKALEMSKQLNLKTIPEELKKIIYCPAGLTIGGKTPEEIAISISAQIIEVKNKLC